MSAVLQWIFFFPFNFSLGKNNLDKPEVANTIRLKHHKNVQVDNSSVGLNTAFGKQQEMQQVRLQQNIPPWLKHNVYWSV